MAHVPPEQRVLFGADLGIGYEAGRSKVIPKGQTSKENFWQLWVLFCASFGYKPLLEGYPNDPIDFFIVFAIRYRRGDIGKSQQGRPLLSGAHPVRLGTVQAALQAVGERFAELGLQDPRIRGETRIAPRLAGIYRFFGNEDPPASRLWPATLAILREMHRQLQSHKDQSYARAIMDLCVLGFFFLCRPGEYAVSSSSDMGRSSPFRLEDVAFSTNDRRRCVASTCPLNDVRSASFVSLTFTDQKNAVKGEAIGHHTNRDPIFDPVVAVGRRVLELRDNNAPPSTPLHTYYPSGGGRTRNITTLGITWHLRDAAAAIQQQTGIPPDRLQAYSLRSGGATAMLVANIATDKIQLIGRWKSDAVFRYLRVQAAETSQHLSTAMLTHGSYTFAPTTTDQDLLPLETPAAIVAALLPLHPIPVSA